MIPGPPWLGDLFESPVAQVAVKILVLGIFQIGLRLIDLGINMPIRHENIEPAVVIHIEEADAPAQQPRIHAQSAGISAVFEGRVAEVGIERIGVAGEVGLHHVADCRRGCSRRWKRPCRPAAWLPRKAPRPLRSRCRGRCRPSDSDRAWPVPNRWRHKYRASRRCRDRTRQRSGHRCRPRVHMPDFSLTSVKVPSPLL